MGDTSDASLETAVGRNGLVSGAKPWSQLPHRSGVDDGVCQRASLKAPCATVRGRGRAARPRPGSSPVSCLLLQGRPGRVANRGLRAEERGTSGTGPTGLPGGSKSPFGDVGVRFGGSEHHQGRAPAFRTRRDHLGGRGRPRKLRRAEANRAPRGTGGGLGRRTVRTGSRTLLGGLADRAVEGLGPGRQSRSQRPRPADTRRERNGFGRRARATPARASAHGGAGIGGGLGPVRCKPSPVASAAGEALLDPGRASPGEDRRQQGQEGNGRSDAVRLLMRGTLRRV